MLGKGYSNLKIFYSYVLLVYYTYLVKSTEWIKDH